MVDTKSNPFMRTHMSLIPRTPAQQYKLTDILGPIQSANKEQISDAGEFPNARRARHGDRQVQ
jgi:hypothetical protein